MVQAFRRSSIVPRGFVVQEVRVEPERLTVVVRSETMGRQGANQLRQQPSPEAVIVLDVITRVAEARVDADERCDLPHGRDEVE